MSTHLSRLRWSLAAVATAVFTLSLAAAGSAHALNKVGADLRVVAADGETLVDQRQYTGAEKVKTSPKANCFGQGTGGSGGKINIPGATALGIVSDASENTAALRPLLLTDAFDFGVGICGFGKAVAPSTGFWYLKIDHVGSTTGGDQTTLKNGNDVLWYLVESFEDPTPNELELKAPVYVKPGQDIKVRVFAYADNGKKSPAAGATVGGVVTDAKGRATVPQNGGSTSLVAQRDGDIPSRVEKVCSAQKRAACPKGRVLQIHGSGAKDKVKAPKREVVINTYGGKDQIDVRRAARSAPPVVKCGGGKDVVVAKKKQKLKVRKSCERVKRV